MTVISYPPKTSAEEMRRNRQARRVACNAAEACACGSSCPRCGGTAHTFLGRSSIGRRLRCAGCRAEFTGVDMFTVIDREGTGEHFVGVLGDRLRCTCEAQRWRRECWALERVRAYLRRETARATQSPASQPAAEPTTDELFATLGDDAPRPKLQVVR